METADGKMNPNIQTNAETGASTDKPPYPDETVFKPIMESARLLLASVKAFGKFHLALTWDTRDKKWVFCINVELPPPEGIEAPPDSVLMGLIAVVIPPEDMARYQPEGATYAGLIHGGVLMPKPEPGQAQ